MRESEGAPARRAVPTMLPRLFNLASCVSLVLAIGVLCLWGHSYWWEDTIEGRWNLNTVVTLRSFTGETLVRIETVSRQSEEFSTGWKLHSWKGRETYQMYRDCQWTWKWERMGFRYIWDSPDWWFPTRRYTALVVPHWFLVLVCLALPTLWLLRWKARPSAGHCQHCGYDLRGSTTAGVCPECGRPFASLVRDKSEHARVAPGSSSASGQPAD